MAAFQYGSCVRGANQRLVTVGHGAPVARVQRQGTLRPGRQALVAIIVGCVVDEVRRELTPHDEFLEEAVPIDTRGRGALHGQRDLHRGDLPEMQVRGQHGYLRLPRPGTRRHVAAQAAGNEGRQPTAGLQVAAAKLGHRRDTVIQAQTRQQSSKVIEADIPGHRQRMPRHARTQPPQRSEEALPVRGDLGPQRARTDLRAAGGNPDRHDHIPLHAQHAPARRLGDVRAPLLLDTQVAVVADHERGAARQAERHLVGRTAPHDERNTARPQAAGGLLQALQHEGVVPGIGLGEVVHEAKADQQRQ